MSAQSTVGQNRPTLRIRGASYPVVLPKLTDPRLHLATTFVFLHTLGQIEFHFRVSIVQIFTALLTCGLIEAGLAFRRQGVILWPASALLTGNGIAFILRVPGTEHGDWWSTRGWWIYAGVGAVSLLSKYLITFRGRHIFNPSNLGLVLFFLVLGSTRTEPLEFWWGPTSPWLVLALGIIVCGALGILSRLHLLGVAVGFWLTFTATIGVLAASGHAMSANWHLGPVSDGYFWRVLILSPEVFIFLSFMITDPRTVPESRAGRRIYAISIGMLSALLIAPQQTEFGSKVALLGSLTLVCAARPIVILLREAAARSSRGTLLARAHRIVGSGRLHARSMGRLSLGTAALLVSAVFAGLLVLAGSPARSSAESIAAPTVQAALPQVTVVRTARIAPLERTTALTIAGDVVADLNVQADALRARDIERAAATADGDWLASLRGQIGASAGHAIAVPAYRVERMRVSLEPGVGQGPPKVVTVLTGSVETESYGGSPATLERRSASSSFERTFEVALKSGRFVIVRDRDAAATPAVAPAVPPASLGPAPKGSAAFAGLHLTNVAPQVGLRFRQGAFRYGMSADPPAMMGGGLCFIDFDNDGWLDLFAVNSYADQDIPGWQKHGGLPRSALFHNVHGKFVNVSRRSGADLQVRGSGCVAADLDGDGYTDLFVTTAVDDKLLWNNGDGTFSEGARAAGIVSFGWHSGAAVSDVNGDGRPDLFLAGYTDMHAQIAGSMNGFPTNYLGVRDLLFLNEGPGESGRARFKEVGRQAGLDTRIEHGLGAVFSDLNADGRPDLYVANDEDPNRLYMNVPWPGGAKADPKGIGFRFEDRAHAEGVDDPNAGMGVADGDYNGDGRPDLFITNSRDQQHAAFASQATAGAATSFTSARSVFAVALGRRVTVGWGASWIDLDNDRNLDLVLANGAIPVTNLKKDTQPIQVLENLAGNGEPGQIENASGIVSPRNLPPIIGRGLAAADYDNDGSIDFAINSIGGPLVLLHNTGARGHWLEVSLAGFHPGAIVTATLPDGRTLVREIHAGSSYLSSEDPRVHFGLADATEVSALTVRYPDGTETKLANVAADQILSVKP